MTDSYNSSDSMAESRQALSKGNSEGSESAETKPGMIGENEISMENGKADSRYPEFKHNSSFNDQNRTRCNIPFVSHVYFETDVRRACRRCGRQVLKQA